MFICIQRFFERGNDYKGSEYNRSACSIALVILVLGSICICRNTGVLLIASFGIIPDEVS
jgi:hypothetical protein